MQLSFSSGILFRNVASDLQHFGVFFFCISRHDFLHSNIMFPLVSVIKEIICSTIFRQMMPDITFSGKLLVIIYIHFIPHSSTAVFTFKAVKMIVIPFKKLIYEVMQFLKCAGLSDQDIYRGYVTLFL